MLPVSMDTVTLEKRLTVADGLDPASKKKTEPRKKEPKQKRRKYKLKKDVEPTSPLGVLNFEIDQLMKDSGVAKEDFENPINALLNNELDSTLYHRVVTDVEILKFTSNGDGLAIITNPEHDQKKQIAIVPFGIPGDIVTIKVFKTHPYYVESDLVSVLKASQIRDDSLINCKYFGVCSGCQYQDIEYEKQLEIKKDVITNAYKFFAPILFPMLPKVLDTESSPLKYEYRTKLTPHFDVPRRKPENYKRPNLGFGAKGRPIWRDVTGHEGSVMDIEECVIGTKIINKGMELERNKFKQNFNEYKKGATILLREHTEKDESLIKEDVVIRQDNLVKTYVTKPRQIVKEIIGGFEFEFSAGEFFQNNNSILPRVIEYVSENLQLQHSEGENYLIDAYCGSGLFSITASRAVTKSIGVEISADSVKFAQRNANLNNITNCEFIVGKLEKIFGGEELLGLPNDKTSIILDPPRKGCDEIFMKQLSDFKPVKIIYISCNVHSQARDLEYFINNTENGKNYHIDSIKGFDFFPQTHHVESIAVLSLSD